MVKVKETDSVWSQVYSSLSQNSQSTLNQQQSWAKVLSGRYPQAVFIAHLGIFFAVCWRIYLSVYREAI